MIPATSRHVCLAFLRAVWSALPVLTWPPRIVSDVAPEPQATAAEETFAAALTHLEYLGYEVGLDPDGWSTAQHPARYNFHLRPSARGVQLHCAVGIGACAGNTRAALLAFMNTANERSYVTQFSLFEDDAGIYRIRMRALVSGAYSRPVFGMMMDLWHEDLAQVRRMPRFLEESAAIEGEGVSVTVN